MVGVIMVVSVWINVNQKKEYGVLGSMCDDCDKYYCEVDGECKDEIIKND